MKGAEVILDDEAAACLSDEEAGAAVRVVVVCRLPDSPLVVPLAGGAPVDLRSTANASSSEVVQGLLDSSLELEAASGIHPEVVDAVRRVAVPPLFRASPWLRRYRPLVLEDGHIVLAGVRVIYRIDRGLCVEPADLTTG